jgi:hypothetical protein
MFLDWILQKTGNKFVSLIQQDNDNLKINVITAAAAAAAAFYFNLCKVDVLIML